MTEKWTDERLDRLANTLDSFKNEASRLLAKLGENQSRNDAAVEVLVQSVTRLTQSQEIQWQIIKERQTDEF